MTHLEFHKLPLRFLGHMSFDTEHLAAYKAETPKGDILMRIYTHKRKNGEFGKSVRIYKFRGKEFKSVVKLLKDYNGTE